MTKMVDYESMIDLSQIKNLLKVFLIFLFSSLVILVSFQKRMLYSRWILSPDKFYHKITVNIFHEYVIYVLERLATQKCGTQSFARRDTSDVLLFILRRHSSYQQCLCILEGPELFGFSELSVFFCINLIWSVNVYNILDGKFSHILWYIMNKDQMRN